MRKFRSLVLGLMAFLALFLVSCGAEPKEKPEDVAKKAVESILFGDPNKSEDVKVVTELLKENYKEAEVIDYFKKQSVVALLEEEFSSIFKELKIEEEGKKFFEAYLGGAKIKVGKVDVKDSEATVQIIAEIPDVYSIENIDKIMEKEMESKKEEIKKLKKEEDIEKAIVEITKTSMNKFIEKVKKIDKYQTEEAVIKLKKQKGAWHIIEI